MTSLVSSAPALDSSPQLATVRRRWASRRALALAGPALALLGLLAVAGLCWPALRGLALGVGVLALAGLGWQLRRLFRTPLSALARLLDRRFPVLEDSTGLLLQDAARLNLLESLQQQRVGERLAQLEATRVALLPVSFRPAILLTVGLLAAAAGTWVFHTDSTPSAAAPVVQLHFREKPTPAGQPVPPRLLGTLIRVSPPRYTRHVPYNAAQPSFRCPQGSRVRWMVRVSRPATAPPVLELGQRQLVMQPVPGHTNEYAAEAELQSPALYRIRFAGQVSDDYAIEVQPDQAPTVRLLTPKAYTLVEFGRPPQVAISATLQDDYGLTRARLVATVAQGQGEAVKFREVTTDLSASLRGQPTQATLRHVLRLPALGLTYGDEVYFYVQTWDNQQHSTRSDTYLVQWEDTTAQSSALDASLGVNTAPAYFRSQRQIIIDTEKLLAEQPRLPAATLLERANAIGFDQKVLRLRYGKFLGEEGEHGIGEGSPSPSVVAEAPEEAPGLGSVVAEDHAEPAAPKPEAHTDDDGHDHAAAAPPDAGAPAGAARTAELMEPYIHRHDDSETADFLEPAVKSKLQAVLSQMWESELRLRTGRPREALPFEYRALRLLKQVQQQTRAYVKKAGFTPPPMPEATTRLTGDLTGAAAPRRQQQLAAPVALPAVREALQQVGRLRQGLPATARTAVALDLAGGELARASLQQPGRYLTALRALRNVSGALRAGRAIASPDLPPIERALTSLLPPAAPTPHMPAAVNPLARRYFQALDAVSR